MNNNVCVCGKQCVSNAGFKQHAKTCSSLNHHSDSSSIQLRVQACKRRQLDVVLSKSYESAFCIPVAAAKPIEVMAPTHTHVEDHAHPLSLDNIDKGLPSPLTLPPSLSRRPCRARRATQKVHDMAPNLPVLTLPQEDLYTIINNFVSDNSGSYVYPAPASPAPEANDTCCSVDNLTTVATMPVHTPENHFGLYRVYSRALGTVPATCIALETDLLYVPTVDTTLNKIVARSVAQIIEPHPNFSSWMYNYNFWVRGNVKSLKGQRRQLKDVLCHEDFQLNDIKDTNFDGIDKQIKKSGEAPWRNSAEGWVQCSVTIRVPVQAPQTQQEKQDATSHQLRLKQADDVCTGVEPSANPVDGIAYTIHGLWMRSITSVIKSVWANNPLTNLFQMQGFKERYVHPEDLPENSFSRSSKVLSTPLTTPMPPLAPLVDPKEGKQVYGQVYTLPAFLEAEEALHQSPLEPGCSLPRVIAALMFWSDTTQLANFGSTKLWPLYMFFGNLDKYIQRQPSAGAAHHIAYFPSLPNSLRDWLCKRTHNGKIPGSLLAHCSWELYQGVWNLLLDLEFMEAYIHGIVIKCVDGIWRQVYPCIFCYCADYPEK
jgi:hypothetical protein